MFITFEGGEGSGKSTQSRLLAQYLRSIGKKVVVTQEPGGTRLGTALRKILLYQKEHAPITELLLFEADRAEHVEQVIKKGLKRKKIVICDRYSDSTLAYQVGGRKLKPNLVKFLNKVSSGDLVPDLTFLLDLPVAAGLKRAEVQTRFEKQKISFHKNVRKYFLKLALQNPGRIKVIDSTRKMAEVQEEIRKICKAQLSGKSS